MSSTFNRNFLYPYRSLHTLPTALDPYHFLLETMGLLRLGQYRLMIPI